MALNSQSLHSRPVRLLVAILTSALLIVLNLLPENPLRASGRRLTAAVIFVAYAAYVQLSPNPRGGLPIAVWETVLLGAISGCTIAMLIWPAHLLRLPNQIYLDTYRNLPGRFWLSRDSLPKRI